MSMKNSNDTIGNRTRDLQTCSSVSQPTAPPRSPRMFEYKLDLSRYANLYVVNIRVSCKAWISCVVFSIKKVYGNVVNWLIVCVSSIDNLYAGVFHFRNR